MCFWYVYFHDNLRIKAVRVYNCVGDLQGHVFSQVRLHLRWVIRSVTLFSLPNSCYLPFAFFRGMQSSPGWRWQLLLFHIEHSHTKDNTVLCICLWLIFLSRNTDHPWEGYIQSVLEVPVSTFWFQINYSFGIITSIPISEWHFDNLYYWALVAIGKNKYFCQPW